MKTLLASLFFLAPLAAHADISISCNHDKIVFGDDDEEAGKGSQPSLGVDGKDVDGIRLVFHENDKSYDCTCDVD